MKNMPILSQKTEKFEIFVILLLRNGWLGGPENGNFPLLYVVKMSLRRWVGGFKKASKHPYLRNIKMASKKQLRSLLE